MRAYGEVLQTPGVARIMAAQLVARFPQGMYSLGLLLHVERTFDSYAAAGLVLAALSIGQGIAGPLTTRWMSRWGTRPVLLLTLAVAATSILTIALAPLSLVAMTGVGALAGLAMPPITPAVRTLYPTMVTQRLLTRLFSLDATLQEIIWVVGPVAITIVSTQVGTVEGLVSAAAAQLLGGLWFILSPEVGRMRIPPSAKRIGGVLKKVPVVLVVVTGMLLIGGFAASEASVVAVFGHDGFEAGIVIAANAFGSLVGGLALGGVTIHRRSLAIRIAVCAVGFGLACLLLELWWLALMFFLAGIGIAPALSAMSSIVAATVKFSDTPEAYGWIGSGQLIGAAVGSAVAGILIDWQGPIGGFVVAFVLASAAAIVAWVLRSKQPDLTQGIGEPPETAPVELPR